jgi:hypothetical protein
MKKLFLSIPVLLLLISCDSRDNDDIEKLKRHNEDVQKFREDVMKSEACTTLCKVMPPPPENGRGNYKNTLDSVFAIADTTDFPFKRAWDLLYKGAARAERK